MSESERTRILVVEDNPDTQVLLRYLLRPSYDLEIASRVEEALRQATAEQVDLFLLDINLGESRTGIDLLQRLRQMNAYSDTPALAITAYALPGDQERFFQAGFNGYVAKPFTRASLLGAIEEALVSGS